MRSQKAKNQPGLSQEMVDTVVVAITLFDEAAPLMQRVQLLSGNAKARTVALEWDPTSIVGIGAEWFLETPRLQHMRTDCFLELAPVFVDPVENLLAKVTFPILKQSLALYQTLRLIRQAGDESKSWLERLMSAALSARLAIPNKLASEGNFVAEAEVPTEVASAVWKATATYMAFVKSGVPEWYETWKNSRTLKAGYIKLTRETKSQAEDSAAAPEGKPTDIVHAEKGQGEQAAEVKRGEGPDRSCQSRRRRAWSFH